MFYWPIVIYLILITFSLCIFNWAASFSGNSSKFDVLGHLTTISYCFPGLYCQEKTTVWSFDSSGNQRPCHCKVQRGNNVELLYSESQVINVFSKVFCLYCPSDMSLTKLKQDIHFFIQETLILQWTFNSGFALTSYWTTWPWLIYQVTWYILVSFHAAFWNHLCFSGNRVEVTSMWLLPNQRSFLLKQEITSTCHLLSPKVTNETKQKEGKGEKPE